MRDVNKNSCHCETNTAARNCSKRFTTKERTYVKLIKYQKRKEQSFRKPPKACNSCSKAENRMTMTQRDKGGKQSIRFGGGRNKWIDSSCYGGSVGYLSKPRVQVDPSQCIQSGFSPPPFRLNGPQKTIFYYCSYLIALMQHTPNILHLFGMYGADLLGLFYPQVEGRKRKKRTP